ncbi:MAG: acetyl-CoA C-acetyltransferase [Magnetococcales bacterium]|nr:acetyl-CoA C-acetyltransferase [Magnetococcales bacterium]
MNVSPVVGKALEPVYVVDGTRTPFLKALGRPNSMSAADLAVAAGRHLLLRQPFEPQSIDEVILGCVLPAPDEANIARVVSLRLGCGHETPAWTVQRNCASGMQAIDTAIRNIQNGSSRMVLAGGVEAMSRAPLQWRPELVSWFANWRKARGVPAKMKLLGALSLKQLRPVVALLKGLTDPVVGLSMGQTGEILAHRFGITREEMDAFALESHQRLNQAQEEGLFKKEVTPLFEVGGGIEGADQGLRKDSTLEALGRLKPVFDRHHGQLTAGNSAQVSDGAALLLLADEQSVMKHNLRVLGRVTPAAWAGLDPAQMGLGPVHAIAQLLKREKQSMSGIDYWEINEAFAAQVLACDRAARDADYGRKALGLDGALGGFPRERLNVDGGAISIGHPVGASGARIVLHLLNLLQSKNARRGIAALCIGGGQGGAMLAEAV